MSKAVIFEGNRAQGSFEKLPGGDLVEHFEEKHAEHDFTGRARQIRAVDDVTNEVLAYPVRGAIGVSELVRRQDRVVSPGWSLAAMASKEDLLPVGRRIANRYRRQRMTLAGAK